jgi:hypothetical protein
MKFLHVFIIVHLCLNFEMFDVGHTMSMILRCLMLDIPCPFWCLTPMSMSTNMVYAQSNLFFRGFHASLSFFPLSFVVVVLVICACFGQLKLDSRIYNI